MLYLRTILTCLAIASLLVSDAVIAVHSANCSPVASCSPATQSSETSATDVGNPRSCSCHSHACTQKPAEGESSLPAPAHDCDRCTICRGALICRFAVVCDAVLPPAFEVLADWVTDSVVTLSLGQEFSSALSQRGPPA